MNIFILDKDPALAAKYLCDIHVVRMILESFQMLSTVHRVWDCENADVLEEAAKAAAFLSRQEIV